MIYLFSKTYQHVFLLTQSRYPFVTHENYMKNEIIIIDTEIRNISTVMLLVSRTFSC
jgi:hypothetical protein